MFIIKDGKIEKTGMKKIEGLLKYITLTVFFERQPKS